MNRRPAPTSRSPASPDPLARPGFGARHPSLAALVTDHEPAATGEVSWLGGTMPLRVTAYATPTDLPEDLVTSERCVVLVGDLVVLCENADGTHPLPGGRRRPGESYADTAVREVHEETGCLLDRATLPALVFLDLVQDRGALDRVIASPLDRETTDDAEVAAIVDGDHPAGSPPLPVEHRRSDP